MCEKQSGMLWCSQFGISGCAAMRAAMSKHCLLLPINMWCVEL